MDRHRLVPRPTRQEALTAIQQAEAGRVPRLLETAQGMISPSNLYHAQVRAPHKMRGFLRYGGLPPAWSVMQQRSPSARTKWISVSAFDEVDGRSRCRAGFNDAVVTGDRFACRSSRASAFGSK